MTARNVNDVSDREPLLPRSQVRGQNWIWKRGSYAAHAMINEKRGWYWLCNCARPIRGVHGYSKLGARRRRDYRWADRYRCWGRLPDRADRW